jgi:hypothetical protein
MNGNMNSLGINVLMLNKVKKYFQKEYVRYKAHAQNKPEVKFRLSCNSISLTVYKQDIFGNQDESSIDWKEVEFAFVYKQDLFTSDRICMYLGKSQTEGLAVHEEMEGWDELEKHLPEYLPGALNVESWWANVVFPAFETNLTLVYKDPAYPDSEIQKMMEGQSKKKPGTFRCLMDILLYVGSFLPWALCFFSRIAGYRYNAPLLLNILFWLGIILILPCFIILVKTVIRFMSWGDLFNNPKIGEKVSGVLFIVSVFIYTVAMAISISVF